MSGGRRCGAVLVSRRPRTRRELRELLRSTWVLPGGRRCAPRRLRSEYLVWCGEFPFDAAVDPLQSSPVGAPLHAEIDLHIMMPRGTMCDGESVRRIADVVERGAGVCIMSWNGVGRAPRVAQAVWDLLHSSACPDPEDAHPELSLPLGAATDVLARRLLSVHPARRGEEGEGGELAELYARLLPQLKPMAPDADAWGAAVAAYLVSHLPAPTLLRHVGVREAEELPE